MEWVYYDKFNNVGTAPSAIRAEVRAEKHLRALRARKERREQRLGAAEDNLLRSSRMQRERESRQERAAPAIPHGLMLALRGLDEVRLRREFDAHSDLAEGERRMNKAGLARLIRSKGLAHGDAEVGRVLERVDANGDGAIDFGEFCAAVLGNCDLEKVLLRDRLRSRELASLLAFLGDTAGEAPAHVEAKSAEECNRVPPPVVVVDSRGAGLERLYEWGVTKQRARNCKAQSSVEQAVGMQIACHLALSFPAVLSRDAPAGRSLDSGVCPGGRHVGNVTHSITHSSDVASHTHSRPAWAGTGGVPISREDENDGAVREEIRAANSRRHMMRERAPLPKAALALNPLRTNARTNAAVASISYATYATYAQPPGVQRMLAKEEVGQMSGDDLQPQMKTWSIETNEEVGH